MLLLLSAITRTLDVILLAFTSHVPVASYSHKLTHTLLDVVAFMNGRYTPIHLDYIWSWDSGGFASGAGALDIDVIGLPSALECA